MSDKTLYPNTFQHHNAYVDRIAYYLTGNEEKVLNRILREIMGWEKGRQTLSATVSLSILVDGKFSKDTGERLASGCGLKEGAVRNALNVLVEYNIIRRVGEPDLSGQTYALNLDWDSINWALMESRASEKERANKRQMRNARRKNPKTDPVLLNSTRPVEQDHPRPVEQNHPRPVEQDTNKPTVNPSKHTDGDACVTGVEKDTLRKRLEDRFCEMTGLQHPRNVTQRERRAAGSMWYTPLREIAELANWNEHDALSLLEATVKHLLGQVTISAPNSIIKTARAAAAGTVPGVPWKREARQGPQKRTIQIIDPETGDTIEVEAIV